MNTPGRLFAGLLLALLHAGCQTPARLAPVDLRGTDWTVRQGQVVWVSAAGQTGVAGELLLAIRADGACFVQFSKPPFTLVTAQADGRRWSVERPSARWRRAGHGRPPMQWGWFALAQAVAGRPPPAPWQFEPRAANDWRLVNLRSGESLEGYWGR